MKTFAPPRFCPLCGMYQPAVRHVTSNVYELACEACERTAVVLVDDFVKLPSVGSSASGRDVPVSDRVHPTDGHDL